MDIATIIGLVVGSGLLLMAILLKTSIMAFVDVSSVLIVFGGTVSATLVAYPLKPVIGALKTSIKIMFAPKIQHVGTFQEMIKIANLARKEGPLALEKYKSEDPYLKKALGLVADGTKGATLRDIMELERDAIEERHAEGQAILEKMGDFAPAWGMIGTLIGLVIMMLNLSDPSSIGPSMAVALLTTFYGALWANFILLPASNKLSEQTKREMLNIQLMIETMISISETENPRLLQERLLGFLPPKDRALAAPPAKKGG